MAGFLAAMGGGQGLGMAAMGAGALLPTLFGSGGRVGVPSRMAMPGDPTSKFVDDKGMLREDFRVAGLDNEMLKRGRGLLGGLEDRAMLKGPSQQAQYLQEQAKQNAMSQRDQLARDAASQMASAQTNLAMKGGLGSGARERMAQSSNLQGMMGRQQIGRDLAGRQANILAQDEAQKLGLLRDLPGQYKSFGDDMMRRQVADRQGGMGLLMDKYGRDMQAYAANQIARAQAQGANAAGKGILSGLFG